MVIFLLCLLFYSVIKLQHVISSETGIPVESQVLLISGGEPMSPNSRVCTYSAGTVSINCIHTSKFRNFLICVSLPLYYLLFP